MGYAKFLIPGSKGLFMSKIKSVNDFVIKFANVNGSGSASANQMFAKGVSGLAYQLSKEYFSLKYTGPSCGLKLELMKKDT